MAFRTSLSFKAIVKKAIAKTPYSVVRRSTLSKLSPVQSDMVLSLVVASYNVAPYIERFLASIFGQTVLPKRFEVILVNDGSTDQTGAILDDWKARYPDHIRVIHQENRGVCAARNAGLALARGTWVGFPDPDDFLDLDYFKHMLAEIGRKHKKPLLAVVSNLIYYFEDRDEFLDSHPLRYRFAKPISHRSSHDLEKFIQLATNCVWMHRPTLALHGITFDDRVKPSAEDMHFINRLLLAAPDRTVSFLKEPVYNYRKRSDGSSLLDKTKSHIGWFSSQIRYGYIDLLSQSAKAYGKVPAYIQRTCLYSIVWRFRYLVDQPHRSAFLSQEQRADFLNLLQEAFAYIDADTIESFNLAGCTEEHKVALLALYKGKRRDVTSVYVEQVDSVAALVQFSYHTGADDDFGLKITINGAESTACLPSCRTTDFMGQTYFRQHFFWLPLKDGDDVAFDRNGVRCIIKRGGNALGERVNWVDLRYALVPARPRNPDEETQRLRDHVLSQRDVYRGGLVLMDRDDKADDNAEHLYRYLMQTGRAEKAWFILKPDSRDWSRLKAEGFKLLAFRSDEHVAAQMNADFLLSSHADHHILWPVARPDFSDLARFQFIFLQHGVIQNDLSHWLNSKPMRGFVTTMPAEYRDIIRPDGSYIFTAREVLKTGLPRHDALWAKGQVEKGDLILIMPTWRKYLTDETNRDGMQRKKVSHFLDSDYARNWMSFLKSPRLEAVARAHDLRIVFAPHPNVAMYIEDMKLPKHVQVVNVMENLSYQDLFIRARLAVTCFSSAATEVAFLQRPVVYFQFDSDAIFSGGMFTGVAIFLLMRMVLGLWYKLPGKPSTGLTTLCADEKILYMPTAGMRPSLSVTECAASVSGKKLQKCTYPVGLCRISRCKTLS